MPPFVVDDGPLPGLPPCLPSPFLVADDDPALVDVVPDGGGGGAEAREAEETLKDLEDVLFCLREEVHDAQAQLAAHLTNCNAIYAAKLKLLTQKQELLGLARRPAIHEEATALLQEVREEIARLDDCLTVHHGRLAAARRRVGRLHDTLEAIELQRVEFDAGFIDLTTLEDRVVQSVVALQSQS